MGVNSAPETIQVKITADGPRGLGKTTMLSLIAALSQTLGLRVSGHMLSGDRTKWGKHEIMIQGSLPTNRKEIRIKLPLYLIR